MTSLRAARRGRRGLLLASLLVLALAAGCGGDPAPPTASPAGTQTAGPATVPPATVPPATASPSDEPSPTEGPSPTDETKPTATPLPTPRPTATPTRAAACTGNAENRAFYAAVAEQVAWDVYCPVLPAGWFVDAGTFRLAGGGRLEIAYKGPAGARLEIRQGAWCGEASGCPPPGSDVGPARFGDRQARLYEDGDTPAVFAAGDGAIGWEAVGRGMDGGALASLTAAFTRVAR